MYRFAFNNKITVGIQVYCFFIYLFTVLLQNIQIENLSGESTFGHKETSGCKTSIDLYGSKSDLSRKRKLIVHKTMIKPILTYGI